ncbi:MAG: FAD-dependent oxidoreductase [Solirubrobacteraceae bacterium]|nr:FAD-dependent oxidoreductase [Solirubrobacteraceae bacterium]
MVGEHHREIVIAGGGVAALEALLALRALAGELPRITLLSPEPDFVLRAGGVLEPFARGTARHVPLALICAAHEAQLVADRLAEVDPQDKVARTAAGRDLPYDLLVIALGAIERSPFPGAIAFAGRPQDRDAFAAVLVEAREGAIADLVFAVPAGTSWPLPAYELALLTAADLSERGARGPHIAIVTPEERPLEMFGSAASDDVERRLAESDIELCTLSRPREHAHGRLEIEGGTGLPADRVIALATLAGPAIPGLPCDDEGFLPIDDHCRVRGVLDVFAAGDCTSFPLKQGGLAAQQADAVAGAIAELLGAGGPAEPFRPVLRGLLLTGDEPIYLRAEPGAGHGPRSVAIEEHASFGLGRPVPGIAATRPLWWPPAKVAGPYIGAYLARPQEPGAQPTRLEDREPHVEAASRRELQAAQDLALMMAEGEARFGDWHAALHALEAAEALTGSLPPQYAQKRDLWRAELEGRPGSTYLGG